MSVLRLTDVLENQIGFKPNKSLAKYEFYKFIQGKIFFL